MSTGTRDTFGRPIGNLRISVTDRCNLRCAYCMPEEEYVWLPRESVATFEELALLADAFIACGVERIRLTGGEPLLRRDVDELIRLLGAKAGLQDLALTTNGLLLAEKAAGLRNSGLARLNISLDTLRDDRFFGLTRRQGLDQVVHGIEAARALGFRPLKLDTVVMRGVNDDEILPLLDFARAKEAEIRFIEYMDVGGATRWSRDQVVSKAEILALIGAARGAVSPAERDLFAPAERYALADGQTFGVISSTTAPFCGNCDRARLTADGRLFLCLYARDGLDLLTPLRNGATVDDLTASIRSAWNGRTDRGAEVRLGLPDRGSSYSADLLRSSPHLEMHTRGG